MGVYNEFGMFSNSSQIEHSERFMLANYYIPEDYSMIFIIIKI